LRTSKEGVLRT